MSVLKVEGVTHWSIPVNDLAEAEEFYGELLGLAPVGRLGNNIMSCFNVGDHNILLCERPRVRWTGQLRWRMPECIIPSPFPPKPSSWPARCSTSETSGLST